MNTTKESYPKDNEKTFVQALEKVGLNSSRHFRSYNDCFFSIMPIDGKKITMDMGALQKVMQEYSQFYQIINGTPYYIVHNVTQAQIDTLCSTYNMILENL